MTALALTQMLSAGQTYEDYDLVYTTEVVNNEAYEYYILVFIGAYSGYSDEAELGMIEIRYNE